MGCYRILLPVALIFAVVLVISGVIQNFTDTSGDNARRWNSDSARRSGRKSGGDQELGTNGGGYFNANSAHPFENPTPLTNLVEIFLLLVIPLVCLGPSDAWLGSFAKVSRSSRRWSCSVGNLDLADDRC